MSLTKLTAIVAASIFAACANAQFSTVDRNWDHTTSATAGATVSSTNSGYSIEDFIGSFKALPGTQGDAFANSDIKYINGPGSHTLAVDNNTAFGPHTTNVSATSNAEATWIFNLATQSQWTFSGTFTKVGNGTGSVALDFDDNGSWVNLASFTDSGKSTLALGPGSYRMVVTSDLLSSANGSGNAFSESMKVGASLVQPVPEPATMLSLAIGSAWLLRRRKSRRG